MIIKEEAEQDEAIARIMQREKERERRRQRDRERRQKMTQEQRERHLARRRRNYQLRRIRAQNAKQTLPANSLALPASHLQGPQNWPNVRRRLRVSNIRHLARRLHCGDITHGSVTRLALIHVKRLARAIKLAIC